MININFFKIKSFAAVFGTCLYGGWISKAMNLNDIDHALDQNKFTQLHGGGEELVKFGTGEFWKFLGLAFCKYKYIYRQPLK